MDDQMGAPIGWFGPRGGDVTPDFRRYDSAPVGAPTGTTEHAPDSQPITLPGALAAAQQQQRIWEHEQQQIGPYVDGTRALDRRLAALRRETTRIRVRHALQWTVGGVVVGGLAVLLWRMLVVDTPRTRAGQPHADETGGAAR